MSRGIIHVMLVDDHPVVHGGYRRLLEQTPDLRVVAEATDAEQGYHAYILHRPEVVIMDLSMPGMGGIEAIRRIRCRDPGAKVLVYSVHEDKIFVQRAIEAGARGYITKRSAACVMVEAVRQVAAGGSYFSPDLRCSAEGRTFDDREEPLDALTPREFEVFRHLAEGRTVAEIAELLHASPKTVGVHQTRIMKKLSLTNVSQLTRIAIRYHIVDP